MLRFLLFALSFCPALLLAQERLIATAPLVSGLDRPTAIAHAGDGSGRLFVVKQPGRVRIVRRGVLLETPFLDIETQVSCCGERGLLGIAFHPDYASNGEFFVNYTNTGSDTVVSRFRVSPEADLADHASEAVLLTVDQPQTNHNGGHLAFGPDGYLYIGLGDGGGAGDVANNAQNRQSLLGKMLRIDVDSSSPYGIPNDNPFAADDFTRDEIWALGLRNPFRYSFDRITGDLYIADVGQDAIEEVHVHEANSPSGANYGWRRMEGSRCFNPASGCNDGSLTLPAFEYGHSLGRCSITGGYVYRGTLDARMQGRYLYGDFCSGEIFAAAPTGDNWSQEVLLNTVLQISSFGEDERGELLVADINGGVYRLVAPLALAPASGTLLQTQTIDLSASLRVATVSITSLTATLNGADVSADFAACRLDGTLAEGGRSLRCPDLPLSLLGAGEHNFRLELSLSDGTSVRDSVTWTVLANVE